MPALSRIFFPAGNFNDDDYKNTLIAPEARADPDLFGELPLELTDGKVIYARRPAVNLIMDRLVPAAATLDRNVRVVQGYTCRMDKIKQWLNLRLVAARSLGFDSQRLTVTQELIVGRAADDWGCFRKVLANDPDVDATKTQLLAECGSELEAYAKANNMDLDEVGLMLLSFRATMFQVDLPCDPDSGKSVFNSGGHFDFEFWRKGESRPDFYGVPSNLLFHPQLIARGLFEDPANLSLLREVKSRQMESYLVTHTGSPTHTEESFAQAQDNILLLQEVAMSCGFVPWEGSVRTFSAPNTGGKQAQEYPGHGDASHAVKCGQKFAVWDLVPTLSRQMIEG